MKQFFEQYWKYILIGIIGFLIGILINIPSCNPPEAKIEYIEKHDTIEVEKERIVYKTKIKYVDRIDTFYVKESGDTVPVQNLPIEHKVYEDTIKNDSTSTEIKIEYSGFNPAIENIWLKHNYFEKQETIIQPPKRVGWVWFIGAGPAIDVHYDIPTKTLGWGPALVFTVGVGIGGTIE